MGFAPSIRAVTIGARLQLLRLVPDPHQQPASRDLRAVRGAVFSANDGRRLARVEGGDVGPRPWIERLGDRGHHCVITRPIREALELRHEVVRGLSGEARKPRVGIALSPRSVASRASGCTLSTPLDFGSHSRAGRYRSLREAHEHQSGHAPGCS